MFNTKLDQMFRPETAYEIKSKKVPEIVYCQDMYDDAHGKKVLRFDSEEIFLQNTLYINKHPRYKCMEAHKHSFVEINYMYSGSCIQYVDEQKVLLKEGQLLLMDKETVHHILPLGENDILINIIFRQELISTKILNNIVQSQSLIYDFLKKASTPDTNHRHHLILETEQNEYIQFQLQALIAEFFNQDKYSHQTMMLMLSLVFIELSRQLEQQTLQQAMPSQSKLLSVLAYIDQHYVNLTLKDLAEHFGYNPNYLSNKLKAETNQNFSELLNIKRLSMAALYIRENNYSIEEIAGKIGFESTSSFFKFFKKHYGMTPLQYKKRNCML